MSKIVVPFTIGATDVNTADSSAVTIANISSASNIVQVPTHIIVSKAAGTAYTLSYQGSPKYALEQLGAPDSYSDGFAAGANLLVSEEIFSSGPTRLLFSIPLEGFLDQTTLQARVAFPLPRVRVWKQGPVSYKLQFSVGVSGGTGSLSGRIYFDEYPLGGF